MIRIRNLELQRGGRTVVSRLDLDIVAGQVTAIVGPNGAGKSSLLAAMVGDLPPHRGSVTVADSNVSALRPDEAARLRSFLSQDHPSDIDYPVETVVGFGTYSSEVDAEEAIETAMQAVGIVHLSGRPFDQLSGGEQRRTMIARVLAQRSPVILMDEPTDSLDLGHAELVMQAASAESSRGNTVVITSHDLNIASRHSNRIILLTNGNVAADGTPAEVLTETNLSSIYKAQVRVLPHPDTGHPVVFL